MTDIGMPAEPVPLGPDPEFDALLARLGPLLEATAKAAVVEAVAAVPVPVKRPGSVQGVDTVNRTATVLVDGDTSAIVCQCIIELPGIYDRVMVEFNPSGAVFVVGNQSAAGVPAGTLAPYAGSITAHAGAASTAQTTGQPPRGWLWCAGQAVSRSTYAALYTAIGTTYGSGDGSTTFNVPDYRGRVFIGLDNMGGSDAGRLAMSNTLGGTGGTTTLIAHTHSTPSHSHAAGTLSVASHTHSFSATTSTDGSHTHSVSPSTFLVTGSGQTYDSAGAGVFDLSSASTGSDGSHSHTVSGTSGGTAPSISGSTASDGSGTSGSFGSGTEQLPPYLLCHIIIKT